ncbi:hypothetical protein C942_01917 [Photobacterium marinum]|uniref:Uncharacterized protein n=1 Tax=Photobacterium marinum TaxID=1056511 RepID=L8JBQ0_9GAMM|nr:hypothetical protein C942_01917 [Photobacterium marinum]
MFVDFGNNTEMMVSPCFIRLLTDEGTELRTMINTGYKLIQA